MYEILAKKEYRATPSIAREILTLCGFIIFFALLFLLVATQALQKPLDKDLFYPKLSSILSFIATLCLAYELISGLRNESNRARLKQEISELKHNAEIARETIINYETRDKRIIEIESKIRRCEQQFEHEMNYAHRKFAMAWFGVILAGIATLMQMW